MCVISMVMDHYEPLFPQPGDLPWIVKPKQTAPVQPSVTITTSEGLSLGAARELAELRKLIAEFREAVAAAKTVDKLTAQPDCVDPDKAKLEARVDELERRLAALEPKPKRKPRKGKRVSTEKT